MMGYEFSIPNPLPEEGLVIRPRATFTGYSFLPWIAYSHNSINPRFVLFPDRMECKVLRTGVYRYQEIREIDVHQTIGTNNLIFFFRGRWFTFTANLSQEELKPLVMWFHQQGILLSKRALQFLEENSRLEPNLEKFSHF